MWLTEYRERNGLELYELGRMVRRLGARMLPPLTVSDTLLYRLEIDRNFRTVPKLANLIAEACGATAKQRDELVLAEYRGTWAPPKRPARLPAPTPPPVNRNAPRVTLAIDRAGNIVGRFNSTSEAAVRCGIAQTSVCDRCNRKYTAHEFRLLGITFRYADQWEAMTAGQREADLNGRQGPRPDESERRTGRGGPRHRKAVTVIARDGERRNYRSVNEAAAGEGIVPGTVSKHLKHGRPVQEGPAKGCMFIFT